jgi:uncharacterized protein
MTKRNIVHVEISTSNSEETIKFYEQLFGWKVDRIPQMNYATWEAPDAPGGGFSPVGGDTQAGEVLVHVASDDIEADLKKVKALGGTILRQKTEIPEVGWWGVFKDPTGNKIALYTSLHQH